MAYSVYIHITPSNKCYIGQTSMPNCKSRWKEGYKHSRRFRAAIQKYGWENITSFILYSGLTPEEADEKEKELIKCFGSNIREHGYNIESGGCLNKSHTEETKKLISEASKRCWQNEEYRAKILKALRERNVSDETRAKISKYHKGRPKSKEAREKLSESLKKAHAENPELRAQISARNKAKWQEESYRAKMLAIRSQKHKKQ